jgi:NDP-sugar pyrophosphorylase family protein
MKAVILAGGKGTRLRPYTNIFPKPLVPIDDKPVLEIIISKLAKNGIHDIILAVGHLSELIKTFFDDGSKFGVNIEYSSEDKPLGTAGPLLMMRDKLNETFLLMNGDVLTDIDISDLIKFHHDQQALATVALVNRKVEVDYGVVETDDQSSITQWTEKPTIENLVSMGIYILEPEVLNYIPDNEPFDIPELIRTLIANNKLVKGYLFNGFWLDLGKSEDYEQAVKEADKIGEILKW